MEKETSRQLPPAQAAALEILDHFVAICEKYGFKYVLGKGTALGINQRKGFMPWASSVIVILLYDQYREFIRVCEDELKGTPYYLVTRDNTDQFDEFYIRMAKRSRVTLGAGREKDEKYYDFHISIVPAFYAGNTLAEYRRMERAYIRFRKLSDSKCMTPGMLKTGRKIIRQLKSAYYYSQKKPDDYTRTEAALCRYNKPTKYIYVPNANKNKGCVKEAAQYTERRLYEFEGRQYYSVSDIDRYVKDLYGRFYEKKCLDRPVNQALLEGPEILRRVQLIELDMLIEFDRICRKHGIKYILGAGTLLGAIRHKGFIPWDDDIDVFMLYDEYEKFIRIAGEELDKGKYFLKTQESDPDNNLAYIQMKRNGTKYLKEGRDRFKTHPGIFIDIHPLFNGPATRVGHWIQDKICKFFKTMTWAHMGAGSERIFIKRQYYRLLARVSNKTSYRLFMKFAGMVKKTSDKLTCLYISRNFPENPINYRELHEDIIEIEFEGHYFYAPRRWDDYLKYSYSKDYMRYPTMARRAPKHMPAVVDTGDLYKYN
ncbi:MAG: LicD family protein [Acetivibrionales bacterium]|jgi:lipopolysaccharide cholinephosphotransferase